MKRLLCLFAKSFILVGVTIIGNWTVPALAGPASNVAVIVQHADWSSVESAQVALGAGAFNKLDLIQQGQMQYFAYRQIAFDGRGNRLKGIQTGIGNAYIGEQLTMAGSNHTLFWQTGAANTIMEHQTGGAGVQLIIQTGYGNFNYYVEGP